MFEFLYIPKFNKETLNRFVKFENKIFIEQAKSMKRGTFFISGHFADWELMGFSYSIVFSERLNIIAKIQANKKLNDKINIFREFGGNEIIEIGFSLKTIFEKIRKNEIVCFLIDQSAHPDNSVYVKFFGQIVSTFPGPAKMALKLRPELIFVYDFRDENYNYTIVFEKISYDDLTENNFSNELELTQRMQTAVENVIRNNPGQWLWFHKRFKHTKNQ